MKSITALLCLASCLILPLCAKDDAPHGFMPLSELKNDKKATAGCKKKVPEPQKALGRYEK